MKDPVAVVASFVLIFGFCSVDSAISPMVAELHAHFGVPHGEVLWLISTCTVGVVLTVLCGPALTASFPVARLLGLAAVVQVGSLALFVSTARFDLALAARFVFGLCSGVMASCLWWLTFYGVARSYLSAMIAVMMSARPLATAIGVPLAGLVAGQMGWKAAYWFFAAWIAAGAVALVWSLLGRDEGEKKPFGLARIVGDYVHTFSVPWAPTYYVGFTVNRMCYFGFYAFSGIWFIRHYRMELTAISRALFFIGLGEALINLLVPWLIRKLGHRPVFLGSLALSVAVFPVFIPGALSIQAAVALVTLFMVLDRIYCTALVVTLPQMFPTAENKTVLGSLNTLTAWAGLTAISAFQGRYLEALGLPAVEWVLVGCMVVGSAFLYVVQRATVLGPAAQKDA